MYSSGIAYLLWWLSGCGWLGFHRFYLGKIGTGLLWIFTGGLFGIGSIYDLVTLGRQVKEANCMKAIIDDSYNPNDYSQAVRVKEKESIEHTILKLAKTNKGIITSSELALAAKATIEDAKKALDNMVSKGHAELRVRQSGTLVYVIPDLLDSNVPLID